jgi:hypothetical protein
VPWIRRLVVGISPQRLGFSPEEVHVSFAAGKVALGQIFLPVLRFPLSVSFHQCPIFIFVLTVHLPERKQCSFGYRGVVDCCDCVQIKEGFKLKYVSLSSNKHRYSTLLYMSLVDPQSTSPYFKARCQMQDILPLTKENYRNVTRIRVATFK